MNVVVDSQHNFKNKWKYNIFPFVFLNIFIEWKMLVKREIIDFFESMGYYFNDKGDLELLDVDSVQFISIVIDLEDRFKICIPDELLLLENFQKVSSIENLIKLSEEKLEDER